MPRSKTLSDEHVLEAVLQLIYSEGPDAMSFASASKAAGLSAATLVQRFGSRAGLLRAALNLAWDRLFMQTEQAIKCADKTPIGAVELLTTLSNYGPVDVYADALLVLREDLRDPELRELGRRWGMILSDGLEACFEPHDVFPRGIGELLASQWQGALLWWSFSPDVDVTIYVREKLRKFLSLIEDNTSRLVNVSD